jgi:serine/threonine-protein kinase
MLGKLLDGRYQVVQVLGAGGFGQTYIAKDTRRPGNPTCVVKHLKPASSDPNFLQTARRLFNSEAETLEQLGSHDQIPRLLAYFEDNQEFFLVQEYIQGHPLSAELAPGYQWAEAQVIQMLQEVLSILEFVHNHGVIHRDIKPDNIIRRASDNKLVLVDFGAVKQVRTQMAQEQMSATVAIGTPGYMPSEQGRGLPRPNSDIYSLGMIGIQALTGKMPLQLQEDAQTGEMLWQHLVSVSPAFAAVLNKMVRYHFKDRYQSATEALQALRQLNNPYPTYEPVQPTSNPVVAPTQPSSRSVQETIAAVPNRSPQAPAGRDPGYIPASRPSSSGKAPLLLGTGIIVVAVVSMGYAIHQGSLRLGTGKTNTIAQKVCTVVTQNLNVRSGPDKNTDRLDTVTEGTSLSLTGKEENGWVEISSPAKGWVYGDSEYIDCPSVSQRPTPVSTPKPSPDQPKPVDNGRDTLTKAAKKFQDGDLVGAIALAKSIPSSSATYKETQAVIKEWQQNWSNAETKVNLARKALDEKRWKDVLAYAKDPEFPDIRYWKDQLRPIVAKAESQLKAEQVPSPSPSSSISPSPSPTESSSPSPSPSPQETSTSKTETPSTTCTRVVSDPNPPLKVRSSAEVTANNEVGIVQNGTRLSVVFEQNGWLKIKTSEGEGWVAKKYTQCE